MIKDSGSELEFPNTCISVSGLDVGLRSHHELTAIALTKLRWGTLLIFNRRVPPSAASHETIVWTARMRGMIHSSVSLSAVNWEDNLLKTVHCQPSSRI